MSLWICPTCKAMYGPNQQVCPTDGAALQYATLGHMSVLPAQKDLPADAAKLMRENLWTLYDDEKDLP